jgi:mannose-6-phosphate isomerase-like protein (cupin superfamily)
MIAVKTGELELIEGLSETDADRAVRFTFPIFSQTGAKSTSVVYFEVDPGKHLGTHTDSAEEVLLILTGEGEAVVGDERGPLETGTLAVIPAMVPHDVISTGKEPLRVVGFFSSSTVVSVFDDPFAPIGKRVVGTPLPEEEDVAAP